MSLKCTILGLLSLQPASGYDIKRMIDRSVYFIWNVTGPQIYTTLRTLRNEGLIASESIPQVGKPDKQIHTITEKGKRVLQEFANQPIRAAVTRDEVLLRVFLGNFAEEETILREIAAFLDRIKHERMYMEATEERIKAHPGVREKERRFQLLSLRLKVAQYRVMEQELAKFCQEENKLLAEESKPKARPPAKPATRRRTAPR